MAVSLTLFESFQTGERDHMEYLWVFVGGPMAGGFCASAFYEMIYRK